MKSVTIHLPMPAKELSPNWRGHWAPKAKQKRIQRETAAMLVREQMPRRHRPWTEAEVKIVVTPPCSRRRDRDNLLSAMKGAIDGTEDAGLIADDTGYTYLPLEIRPADKANAGVEMTITKTA